jgi:hypothetical protein
MYNKFEFEVPEIVELFKDDAEKWVREENEERKKAIAQAQSQFDEDGNKKTKKQMKEDADELKNDWDDYYRPVTIKDYGENGYGRRYQNISIDEGTGKFDVEFAKEMTAFDKLKGANKRHNEKKQEVTNEDRNLVKPELQ